ncbi:MAG: CIA30 family protein [Candidatus Competibacteraceae bacterium]|jgi:hypothetical protein|nr:CIA30 family protein [Candidatus Competibacteraceae bacterium]
MMIDDRSNADLTATIGTVWRGFSDRVMGGVSRETVAPTVIEGRNCVRLTGKVSLENNGGFIQMALDLSRDGLLDASAYSGLRLLVRGNGEEYNVHLRTPDTVRPWQSYRASFNATESWQEIRLPFAEFQPYRLDTPLDVSRLRRLGVVAIGRPFQADLCVAEISLY